MGKNVGCSLLSRIRNTCNMRLHAKQPIAGLATSSTVSPEMLTTHSRARARVSSVVSTISLHARRQGAHMHALTQWHHSSSSSHLHLGLMQPDNHLRTEAQHLVQKSCKLMSNCATLRAN